MNPFSKATLDLPKLATVWRRDKFNGNERFNPLFYKLVVPLPLDSSPESLVVVLILILEMVIPALFVFATLPSHQLPPTCP